MSQFNFNRIKELLAKKSKKNTELAKHLGVKVQTVSSWCTNKNQPEIDTLFKISDFLEVEAGELLTLKMDLQETNKKKTKTQTSKSKQTTKKR